MAWRRATDLGARIRALREALGVTQEEFAEMFGVVGQSVSDYENGRSRPSRSRLDRLARQLGIPVTVFSEGGEDPQTALRRARMPQEARSPRGPGRRREDAERAAASMRRDAAKLDTIARLIRSYREAGDAVPPAVLAEWLEILQRNSTQLRDEPPTTGS